MCNAFMHTERNKREGEGREAALLAKGRKLVDFRLTLTDEIIR